jgi:hypothetical protein
VSDDETQDETPKPKLRDLFGDALQEGFNSVDAGMGANYLGDWFVVAEVHTAEGPVLRMVDSGLTGWRKVGMLEFARMDTGLDMLVYTQSQEVDEGEA